MTATLSDAKRQRIAEQHKRNFDLTISRDELVELAPALLASLREFVTYGLCRMNNQAERNMSAKHFSELASAALKQFPGLKLNHVGAETIVTE